MQAQRTTSPARQRGLSFIGVIFIGLLAVAAFAIGGAVDTDLLGIPSHQ
jgi:hypothetical protein